MMDLLNGNGGSLVTGAASGMVVGGTGFETIGS